MLRVQKTHKPANPMKLVTASSTGLWLLGEDNCTHIIDVKYIAKD